ncbi:MAG: DUF433 domain-containing protein [Caldilineae bacterium]|nr:MAG: DUF433 domain-containing protein [Caldilineae bacterium]
MKASTTKHRIQVDVSSEQMQLMDRLIQRLHLRSRAELWREAYATFLWVVNELLSGRRVVSLDAETLSEIDRYKELSLATVQPTIFEHYRYLVARPHPWRRQPCLKGRNMTVGQLVATMKANRLSPEEAAEDLNLPLEQVYEALLYYDLHRDLVEAELREEANRVATLQPAA